MIQTKPARAIDETTQGSTQVNREPSKHNPFFEKEEQLYRKVFSPKIKRKPYKNRSVRKTCEELVASFYPETEVSYEAMKMKLTCKFERCSRPTILAYLGRPETRQTEKVRHTIESGTTTRTKDHTFLHVLPEKMGHIEKFGLAILCKDNKKGKVYFRLFHPRQTAIDEEFSPPQTPPHESFALNESSCEVSAEFKEALAYAQRNPVEIPTKKNFSLLNSSSEGVKEKPVLQANPKVDETRDGDRERESINKEKNLRCVKVNFRMKKGCFLVF